MPQITILKTNLHIYSSINKIVIKSKLTPLFPSNIENLAFQAISPRIQPEKGTYKREALWICIVTIQLFAITLSSNTKPVTTRQYPLQVR